MPDCSPQGFSMAKERNKMLQNSQRETTIVFDPMMSLGSTCRLEPKTGLINIRREAGPRNSTHKLCL